MVRRYGAQLVHFLPAETTELLKQLCTKYRPAAKLELIDTKPSTTSALSSLTGVLSQQTDTTASVPAAAAAGISTSTSAATGGALRLNIPGARGAAADHTDAVRSRSLRHTATPPVASAHAHAGGSSSSSSYSSSTSSSMSAARARSFDREVAEVELVIPTNSVSRYQYAQPRAGTQVMWSLRALDGRAFYRMRVDGVLVAEDEVKEEGSFGQVQLKRGQPVTGPVVLEIENRSVLKEKPVACRFEVRSLRMPAQYEEEAEAEERARPESFIPLYARQSNWLEHFLEFICARYQDETPSTVYDTLLELYLRDELERPAGMSPSASAVPAAAAGSSASQGVAVPQRTESPAGPPDATAATAQPVARDPAAQAKHREEVAARQAKALALLKNNAALYDKSHALVLCETSHFTKGILVLYEALGVYHENIAYHMDHKVRGSAPRGLSALALPQQILVSVRGGVQFPQALHSLGSSLMVCCSWCAAPLLFCSSSCAAPVLFCS
jgi:hypothetical protein